MKLEKIHHPSKSVGMARAHVGKIKILASTPLMMKRVMTTMLPAKELIGREPQHRLVGELWESPLNIEGFKARRHTTVIKSRKNTASAPHPFSAHR